MYEGGGGWASPTVGGGYIYMMYVCVYVLGYASIACICQYICRFLHVYPYLYIYLFLLFLCFCTIVYVQCVRIFLCMCISQKPIQNVITKNQFIHIND